MPAPQDRVASPSPVAPSLLELRDITMGFRQPGTRETVPVLRGVSLNVDHGASVAIVGESGSGKTLTALSVLGLLPRDAQWIGGEVAFEGAVLTPAEVAARRRHRRHGTAMIFQSPHSSLNPVRTVGHQVQRVVSAYCDGTTSKERRARALDLLASVGLRDPVRTAKTYPHQLSGGLAQRAMIAVALAAKPKLLIADEPTTSLDVTIQAEVLDLLAELRESLGMALLMITHDLGVVSQISDRVIVMKSGEVVESGAADDVFRNPQSDYTQRLIKSLPRLGDSRPQIIESRGEDIVLGVRDLRKTFVAGGQSVKAVDGISFDIHRGETLALVGESGCGKSTTGRCILGLEQPDGGHIRLRDRDISSLSRREWLRVRSDIQMVFQDPTTSLNPSLRVSQTLREPLRLHRVVPRDAEDQRLRELMEHVQLDESLLSRFPSELSGGQKQRVCIARALAPEPSLIVLDEPTSALDVSLRREVMQLLRELQKTRHLSYLFITHDFASLGMLAHRVIVMYQGEAVEAASVRSVVETPQHAYTRALISSVPSLEVGQRTTTTPTAGPSK